ncbi:hypothetical protein AKJ09_03662 [Labilithrix luteola]|uniref:Uncharacterized protein n=1 Tax=Labilithrix luteola TaxID=1391654 RepID=A0A0K1PTY0_9BACT|nr:hypothetical protein [Labilithrix luteola]AKU96998.1 hypothetical protein AKJ09_03662 [Labilithrix luteola]
MNRLSSIFDLDPGTAAALQKKYGAEQAPMGPPPPPVAGPPAADDLNIPSDPSASAKPVSFWDMLSGNGAPEKPVTPVSIAEQHIPEGMREQAKVDAQNQWNRANEPQGAAGNDGFPTYRDLSGEAAPTGPMPGAGGAPRWVPGTRSGKIEYGIDPETLRTGREHRENEAGARLLAADARFKAARLETAAEAELAQADVIASERANAVRNRIAQERQAYVERERSKFDRLAADASRDVDENAYWKERGGTLAQIIGAIAVGIGQFGASLTGGKNAALEVIQSGIDRNIDAQKANIAKARSAYELRSNLYARNLESIGDPERAALATRAQYLDDVKRKLGQVYTSARGARDEAAYQELLASVESERAKAADEFAKLSHDKKTEELTEKFSVPGAGGGPKGHEALYVASLGGYARDAESARKLNDQGAMRAQINENLRGISGLLEEAKSLNTASDYGRMQEIRSQIDSLKHEVLRETTVLRGQGAMSEGDKVVSERAANLEDVDPRGKTEAQIKRMQKGIKDVAVMHQRDHRLLGEAYGIQLGREEYRAGPNGPEPVAKLSGRNKVVSKQTQNYDDLVEPPKGVVK